MKEKRRKKKLHDFPHYLPGGSSRREECVKIKRAKLLPLSLLFLFEFLSFLSLSSFSLSLFEFLFFSLHLPNFKSFPLLPLTCVTFFLLQFSLRERERGRERERVEGERIRVTKFVLVSESVSFISSIEFFLSP